MELRLSEILRYSGFRSHEPDELTLKKIEQLEDEILASVTPKSIYREFDVRMLENGVEINGVSFLSEALRQFLPRCARLIPMRLPKSLLLIILKAGCI